MEVEMAKRGNGRVVVSVQGGRARLWGGSLHAKARVDQQKDVKKACLADAASRQPISSRQLCRLKGTDKHVAMTILSGARLALRYCGNAINEETDVDVLIIRVIVERSSFRLRASP